RTGTAGNGQRSNWAAAVELRAPVLSTVTLTASLRYDKYENDGGGSYDKPTYKLGAEYRPVDTLLFRANYGTAFRAPDMAYTFGGKSGSFQPGLTDYYLCATKQPGDITKCSYYNTVDPFIQHQGNRGLQPVTAKSWGGGLVWSPTSDLTLKADYYKIKISNEVNLQSADTLLVTESACRLGQLDINSPTCVDALSKVQRGPQGQITQINVLPINISNESVSGIIASANYKLDVGRYGDFQFGLNYNDTLKHSHQTFPGDPTYNNFDDPFNASTIEFKSILTGSVTWDIGPWSTTVFGTRYGAIPNHRAYTVGSFVAGAGHVAPWMIYNGSVSYSFSDDATMSFIVNNIQNSMPPKDPTYTSVPYYNYQVYNVYGRSMFLEMNVKFGRSK
ncbi:MAG: TonB-dependent receptor, partial [Eggerthellaceae bacterium]|nr:TonB-dependent receptor [Eggerthellaceae bacterium]